MVPTWSTSGLDLLLPLPSGRGRRAALEEALREAIADGRLRPGERLPSTRALARDLGAARGTVAEAYAQLVAEGWLRARQGSGTVVAEAAAAGPAAPRRRADPGPGPSRYDLGPGRPDAGSFPRAAWMRALRTALASAPDDLLCREDTRGLAQLRHTLAGYLSRSRGVRTDPELILVCGGFRQALALVCRALVRSGRTRMALEDPTVPYHRGVAEAAGATVTAMPIDSAGAVIEPALRAGVDAVVVTPAHQFPMGVTLAPERRAALVAWARETGGLVLEDDYDGEFRYDRQPIGALQALDPDSVAYAGTASKALAPGLRLGWLVLPPALADAVREQKRLDDGSSPVHDQLALAELIRRHDLDRHLRAVRQHYARRRDRLLRALAEHAPGVRAHGIAAGLHVLLELPDGGPGEDEVTEAAAGRGIRLTPLGNYHHASSPERPALVVGYATPPEHAYDAAVHALARLLGELIGGRSDREH
jgi:GntR family transcriptional regulator / MocR family aminotransferase